MKYLILPFLLVLLLIIPVESADSSGTELNTCIGFYENGEYSRSADCLKATLPTLTGEREAEAYKYLAFSYVMMEMISTAKSNFKTLLEKFPKSDIDTVSVPPNITVVFNQARSEIKKPDPGTGFTLRKAGLISSGLVGAGSGAFSAFYYMKGADELRKYRASTNSLEISQLRKQAEKDYRIGQIMLGTTIACLAAGGYVLWGTEEPPAHVEVFSRGDQVFVACRLLSFR